MGGGRGWVKNGPQTKKVVPTLLPIHKLLLKLIESKSIFEKGA